MALNERYSWIKHNFSQQQSSLPYSPSFLCWLFASSHELPFPLLDDRQKEVIRAYGVNGPMGLGVRRVTFLINPDKKVADRVVADFRIKPHMGLIDSMVEDLGG